MIGADTETHLITPGRLIPPLVCTQYAGAGDVPEIFYGGSGTGRSYRAFGVDCVVNRRKLADGSMEWNALVTNDARLPVFETLMADESVVWVAHNASFDFSVMGEAYPHLLEPGRLPDGTPRPGIFDLYDEGRVRDTQVREMLLAIAGGWFQYDWRGMPGGLDAEGKPKVVKTRYRLSDLVLRYFGVDISGAKAAQKDEKGNDIPGTEPWRLRYCELAGVPAARYPKPAFDYAVEDSEWAVRAFIAQGAEPVMGDAGHPLVSDGDMMIVQTPDGPQEVHIPGLLNGAGTVTDELEQVRAAFGLHLMSAWGVRTEREASERFEEHAREMVAKGNLLAQEAGFLRLKEKWWKRGGVCRQCGERACLSEIAQADACLKEGHIRPCPKCGHEGTMSKNMAAFRARVEDAYTAMGKDVPPTAKGATSTSRETLTESGDPVLEQYAELGVYQKHLTRYVPELQLGLKQPFNPRLNVLVRSGRTSGAIQQPPRLGGYRDCFVPRPGHVFCTVDYDIAELKALAQVHYWWFGTSALGDAINAGEDPHLSLGAELLTSKTGTLWTYAVMKDVLKNAQHPDYDAVANARQVSKPINFGFPGGLGVDSFVRFAKQYGLILTPDEAREMKSAWLAKWVEMAQYFEVIAQMCANGNGVALQAISGRQRGGCSYTALCNTMFQGLVADFAKKGMYQIARASYAKAPASRAWQRALYGARNVLFIHDENIPEIPAGGLLRAAGLDWHLDANGRKVKTLWGSECDWTPEQTTEAADAMTKIMVDVEQEYLPDVTASASPALMRRWYKGAKEVRDENGVLWPWAPEGNETQVFAYGDGTGPDAVPQDEQEQEDQEEAV